MESEVFSAVKPCVKCGAQSRDKRGGCKLCAAARQKARFCPRKLVQGVGVSTEGVYCRSTVDGGNTKEYDVWQKMLERCYNEKIHEKCPTYAGCSVSEDFKNFQFFAAWANKQVGWGRSGWHIDKDILVRGNRVYSAENCVFVPQEVNTLLTLRGAKRSPCGIGVTHWRGGRFVAQGSFGHGRVHLGLFSTPDAAFAAYKTAKEIHIKSVANLYRHAIDDRAYQALMNYQILTD